MSFKLKLNTNSSRTNSISSSAAPTPNLGLTTPTVPTPGGRFKIKFTTNSTPSSPVPEEPPKPKQTKAGRVPKASAKVRESKKRIKDESDDDEEGSTIQVQPPQKKIKLQFGPITPKTPAPAVLKVKHKGKPPKRNLGEGYDSEASDREEDPSVEEQFILRMHPGEDCEYLRQAIAEKKIGIPKSQGGADIHMKFYHPEGRRAAVTVRGQVYAATLVDLPCVIEGMKSWDRRGWWKGGDICQMLWVFAKISKEEEAKTIALPKIVDSETFQYPHGLTPPMHYARKRRFRKRISRTAIEAVEDAVEKLLAADAQAKSSRWEMIQPDTRASVFSDGESERGYEIGQEEYSEDEDAEGEADDNGDYFGTAHHSHGGEVLDPDMDDLEADLEAAMQEESIAATPMSTNDATTMINAETPADEEEDEEDSGDESIEGDDDEEDDAGGTIEVDEVEKARQVERQGVLEDIADLEKSLEGMHANLAAQQNPILKRRLEESIRKAKTELQLKRSSIGEGDDD